MVLSSLTMSTPLMKVSYLDCTVQFLPREDGPVIIDHVHSIYYTVIDHVHSSYEGQLLGLYCTVYLVRMVLSSLTMSTPLMKASSLDCTVQFTW